MALVAATGPVRAALADRLDRVARARDSEWHAARARGLRARASTVEACGSVVAAVSRCGSGTGRAVMRSCGDRHACPRCAQAHARRVCARMRASIEHAMRARARGRGRSRDVLRMLTLTTRHSGDMAADRRRIARAWARHRAWLASSARVRPAYWLVWEVTPGTDGRGHVHAHVIMLAQWYDYGRAREAWRRHTDGASERYDARAVRAAEAARTVGYLAGYLTSSSKAAAWRQAPLALRAAWWAACYGRRAVSAHRGAWTTYTPHCPCCGEVVVWYAPAYRHDPEASLAELARAMAAT